MANYQIDLNFNAILSVEADSKQEAMEKAIEKARDNYGSEVADYGNFTYRAPLRELQGLIGNAYCSNKLSEEAFNHWLKLANLNQEEEVSE